MAGASVRESRLDPGLLPTPNRVRAGRIAMALAFAIVVVALWFGNRWWGNEATSYSREVYKPLNMMASLSAPALLTLHLKDPGWLNDPGWHSLFTRSIDDFIPDHGHLMHLYLIREPGLDVIYHLHPELTAPGSCNFPLCQLGHTTFTRTWSMRMAFRKQWSAPCSSSLS